MRAALSRLRAALAQVSLTRALVGLGMVLVAINVGSAIWDVREGRAQAERQAQRAYSNLTRLLAEQTAASLEAADFVLREAMRNPDPRRIAAAIPRLREQLAHQPQLVALLVLDARGAMLASTADGPALEKELRGQASAAALRKGHGVFAGAPYPGGPDGRSWRFILSRRLNAPGGAFAGVLAAVIEVESFDRLYRTIDLGRGGFITLLSDQGVLITRVPAPPGARGRRVAGGELIDGIRSEGRYQGWFTSPVVGERVLLAASAVRGYPVLVVSGATERAVLEPWHEAAWLVGLRTLLTSAAMLALIALAAWGLARREKLLARREKRFGAVIEHSNDGVILARPGDGGIVWASPSVERMTGHAPASLYGREPYELLHPEHREAALARRAQILSMPGKSMTNEVRVQRKDGSWLWIENTISNLLHEPGVGAVVMSFRDIGERKLAEAERARLEQRLRQAAKMEAVGRLAGGIAHDFNNILGGILGYAEMLVESTAEGSRERRYAQNVLAGANRAGGLVEQILSYSRSQRGKRVPVELDRVAAETLELVRGSLPGGIALEAAMPRAALCVVGDPTQLHQIVMNLCTNAIHAMGERGRLRVALDTEEVAAERALSHSTLAPGIYARLTVEDSGSGMDEDTLARVFEPFFTTKDVGKGTGLGLSLVYGIVTDSSGAIDVRSTPGQGSRFAVYLPKVDSPAQVENAPDGPLERGRGERVLIVDDEEALVAVTSEVLKQLGYEPAAFFDGAAALAQFDAAPERFDAVLTDEVMPGLSGTELARALRGRRADLPIILVSGYIGPLISERARGAGVDAILTKPVQSRELAAALARVLRRQSGSDPD